VLELKLNLGCGTYIKPGWVNVDSHYPEVDLQLDLREKLPFPDGSALIVYSEHFFEHLEYPDQAMRFLGESWRVLIPGGILSIGVPDTEWPIVSYATGDPEYFRLARDRFHPKWCDTRMHNRNYHFRQGTEHKYAYDFETLVKILEEVGFVSVERRSFKPELDSENHRVSSLPRGTASLYVDARKPVSKP
jgi:predicted SAM-dependent methyltransferase